ncbi:MAG TPA: hypothetical protein VNK49_04360 [Anaerolineales bacterium]|nr:hypothetical protein [Anaerolineales bacterium]
MITPTPTNVLKLLRQLPPKEHLKVISLVLPEIEKSLGEKQVRARKSLRGLWAGAGITSKDISALRKRMMKNFPRSDI